MPTKLERNILARIRQANEWWQLFQPGEKVLVGISGGKDSLALLELLSHFDLEIEALHIRLSSSASDHFYEWCRQRSTFHVLETDILAEAHAPDANKNPCFICTRRRRRTMAEFAQSRGIVKIVYGHHKNDAAETFLINQIYGRELSTMMPDQELLDGQFHIIRPLYLVPEFLLESYAREKEIPVAKEYCPTAGKSKRTLIKDILKELQAANPKIDVIDNIFNSMALINLPFLPDFPHRKILMEKRLSKLGKNL